MGIEDEVVEAWERGESVPTHEQLEKFSAMFAVTLSTLEQSIK
jgi:ribosome-binding protein aMBF1 (putative translation factor)